MHDLRPWQPAYCLFLLAHYVTMPPLRFQVGQPVQCRFHDDDEGQLITQRGIIAGYSHQLPSSPWPVIYWVFWLELPDRDWFTPPYLETVAENDLEAL